MPDARRVGPGMIRPGWTPAEAGSVRSDLCRQRVLAGHDCADSALR
jgi:hypothetical protein